MQKHNKNKGWSLLIFLIVLPLLMYGTYQYVLKSADSLPYYGMSQEEGKYSIPDFTFINQDSALFSKKEMMGKVSVVNFFFTVCPSICPKMTRNLLTVEREFEKDKNFQIVSHTVDPKRDDPAKLKKYAHGYGINTDKWIFLTGTKNNLYYMARNGYFVTAIEATGGEEDFIHSEKVMLIDKNGHIRGYYEGTDGKDIQRLIRDARLLLNQ
jgi:protein SCO1